MKFLKLAKKRRNNRIMFLSNDDFVKMMLDDKCNRICVYGNEGKKYKRFDFVGWEEKK